MSEVFEIYTELDPNKAYNLAQARKAKLEEYGERQAAARAAGLYTLAEAEALDAMAGAAVLWCEAYGLKFVSPEDMWVWERWLPRAYSSLGPSATRASMHDYAYHEGVPLHVRKLMSEVRGVFTSLEIRTPEKAVVRASDPALFGVVKFMRETKYVLLARWAESDANWVMFSEIKEIIRRRDSLLPRIMTDDPAATAMLTGLSLVAWFFVGVLGLNIPLGLWALTTLGALAIAYLPLEYRLVQRLLLKRKYPQVASNI